MKILVLLILLTGCKYKYSTYEEYKEKLNIKTQQTSVDKHCSVYYLNQWSGSEHCVKNSDGTIHIQVCGNKGIWCSVNSKNVRYRKETSNQCRYYSGNKDYDEVNPVLYLIKRFINKPNEVDFTTIPNCITGK